MASTERRRKTEIDTETQKALERSGEETLRDIQARIQALLDQAPSDSSAHFLVREVNGGFKGLLKIISSQRKFAGGAEAAQLADVVESVLSEVQEQIEAWRRTRFTSPAH